MAKQKKKCYEEIPISEIQWVYLDYLVKCGLHGNTHAEVIGRLFCDGLRAAVPPGLVALATKQFAQGKSEGQG